MSNRSRDLQRKREFRKKARAIALDAFGPEKLAGMYEVLLIATAPEAQGRGYGTALITALSDKVHSTLI